MSRHVLLATAFILAVFVPVASAAADPTEGCVLGEGSSSLACYDANVKEGQVCYDYQTGDLERRSGCTPDATASGAAGTGACVEIEEAAASACAERVADNEFCYTLIVDGESVVYCHLVPRPRGTAAAAALCVDDLIDNTYVCYDHPCVTAAAKTAPQTVCPSDWIVIGIPAMCVDGLIDNTYACYDHPCVTAAAKTAPKTVCINRVNAAAGSPISLDALCVPPGIESFGVCASLAPVCVFAGSAFDNVRACPTTPGREVCYEVGLATYRTEGCGVPAELTTISAAGACVPDKTAVGEVCATADAGGVCVSYAPNFIPMAPAEWCAAPTVGTTAGAESLCVIYRVGPVEYRGCSSEPLRVTPFCVQPAHDAPYACADATGADGACLEVGSGWTGIHETRCVAFATAGAAAPSVCVPYSMEDPKEFRICVEVESGQVCVARYGGIVVIRVCAPPAAASAAAAEEVCVGDKFNGYCVSAASGEACVERYGGDFPIRRCVDLKADSPA